MTNGRREGIVVVETNLKAIQSKTTAENETRNDTTAAEMTTDQIEI